MTAVVVMGRGWVMTAVVAMVMLLLLGVYSAALSVGAQRSVG